MPRKKVIPEKKNGKSSFFSSLQGKWAKLRTQPWRDATKRHFHLPYLLLAGALGLVLLCVGLYSSLRSYAPVAAHEAPTLTPTPFLPATLTPTPFSPFIATDTAESTVTPPQTPTSYNPGMPWAPYAGPIYPPSIAIHTPVKEFELGPDVMNVALLGMDMRPYGGFNNSDTMIILSLNRAKKTATLISFPRDLYVYIPAYGLWRLNAAFSEGYTQNYAGGGFGLYKDTMKYNFGLRIDHYIMIYFSGFQAMINSIGGIDVYAASTLSDRRSDSGYKYFTVPAGMFHMDGATALWYVRSRATSNDIDRTRRQQEVLIGMTQKLLNLNALGNIPGFFVTLSKYVESDLTLEMITPYLDMATAVSPSTVRRFAVTSPDQCTSWITPQGSGVLLPNYDTILAMLQSALNP